MAERATAVVTGGAGGVGLAVARRLSARHAVVVADLGEDRTAAAVETLAAEGIDATGVACDVTDAASVAALAESAGRVGALVHASGLSPSMADGPTILRVNLIGTALVLGAFLDRMEPGGAGVCVASISGHRTAASAHDALLADPLAPDFLSRVDAVASLERPGAGYALSKRGVILLCERLAGAWGERGARLNSVSPGIIATPMGALEAVKGGKWLHAVSAIARDATAEEIAAAIDWLASDEASFVTGTDLRVDGGSIAGFAHHAPPEQREVWNDPWSTVDPWKTTDQATA